ncbi:hypothetical protein ES703_88296 [subsurface metagenome]
MGYLCPVIGYGDNGYCPADCLSAVKQFGAVNMPPGIGSIAVGLADNLCLSFIPEHNPGLYQASGSLTVQVHLFTYFYDVVALAVDFGGEFSQTFSPGKNFVIQVQFAHATLYQAEGIIIDCLFAEGDFNSGNYLNATKITVVVGLFIAEAGIITDVYYGVHLVDYLDGIGKNTVGDYADFRPVPHVYQHGDVLQAFLGQDAEAEMNGITYLDSCLDQQFNSDAVFSGFGSQSHAVDFTGAQYLVFVNDQFSYVTGLQNTAVTASLLVGVKHALIFFFYRVTNHTIIPAILLDF